jgi:Tfp pilus assembly protein PilF/ribosomal protein L40E
MAEETKNLCKICGASNPPGADTCVGCGIRLKEAKGEGPEVDTLLKGMLEKEQQKADQDNIDELLDSLVVAAAEVACPVCGASIPEVAQTCPACGVEFAEKKPEEDVFAEDLEKELDKLAEATELKAPPAPRAAAVPVAAVPSTPSEQAPAPARARAPATAAQRGVAPSPRRTTRGEEAEIELDVADGDLPKVHLFGSRYVDFVVVGTCAAIVVVFAALGMYEWGNLTAVNLAVLFAIAGFGIVASVYLFRVSVSAVAEGDRLLKGGKYKEALRYYDRAIRIDSRPSAAWTSKGVALKRLELYGEALMAHNMALKLNPRSEVAMCNKGDLLFRIGRVDEALGSYNRAIKVRPRYAVAWNNKAIALTRLGRLEEARACEDEATRLRPKYATAWINKGQILAQLGLRDEAVRCYQRARRLADAGS